MVLNLVSTNGRQQKFIVMMVANLPLDLIEENLVDDLKMSGKNHLNDMVYRTPLGATGSYSMDSN